MVENKQLKQLIQDLQTFQPFNEQEEADVVAILEYIQRFPNIFTRENTLIHVTSSPWIINKERTKVLMVYHNIYQSWSWCGGHNDGIFDCKYVALKEGKEETGLKTLDLLDNRIFAVDILPVASHMKKGKFVSSHLHANITYLCVAEETDTIAIKPDENSAIAWFPIQEVCKYVNEKEMLPVYNKCIHKLMLR